MVVFQVQTLVDFLLEFELCSFIILISMKEYMNKFEEKIVRINFLKDHYFNTPRMLYIGIRQFKGDEITKFIEGTDKVNIRTYKYDNGTESWNSKHYVQIPREDCLHTVAEINDEYVCMIDLEVPGDGILSGNISVLRIGDITLEYCYKPEGGAMVRLHDQSITLSMGSYSDFNKDLYLSNHLDKTYIIPKLKSIVECSKQFPYLSKEDFILEWSFHRKPCGIKQEKIIWWEWRRY